MKHLLLLASLFMAFSQVSAQIAIEDLSDRLVFKDGGTIVARFPKNEIEAVTLISPANTSIRIERQGVFNGTGFAFTATSARVDTTSFVEVAGQSYPNLSSPAGIKDWILFAAGLTQGTAPSGGSSIYTTSDALISNRHVDLAGNSLNFVDTVTGVSAPNPSGPLFFKMRPALGSNGGMVARLGASETGSTDVAWLEANIDRFASTPRIELFAGDSTEAGSYSFIRMDNGLYTQRMQSGTNSYAVSNPTTGQYQRNVSGTEGTIVELFRTSDAGALFARRYTLSMRSADSTVSSPFIEMVNDTVTRIGVRGGLLGSDTSQIVFGQRTPGNGTNAQMEFFSTKYKFNKKRSNRYFPDYNASPDLRMLVFDTTTGVWFRQAIPQAIPNYQDSVGWEQIADSTFTAASPFTVLQGDTSIWEIRGTTAIRTQLPVGVDSFWDGTAHAFFPASIGDGYDIRLDFVAETSTNGGFIELEIDIGPPQGVIVRRLVSFPKGSGFEHAFSVSFPVYTLNTFVANGGQIKIASLNGNTNMHSPGLFIKKDYHAR